MGKIYIVVTDRIRYCKPAKNRGLKETLTDPASYFINTLSVQWKTNS